MCTLIFFQVGYREGIEDGSASVFQDGFDKGYKDGYKTALLLGVYKGIACQLAKDVKHPEEIANVLSDTKRGICYLCKTQTANEKVSKPIIEVENCQSEHSSKILKILADYFDPILKEHNIDPSLINVHT